MNVDPELVFDCLMYLNIFYFPVFGICAPLMCLAKHRSGLDTPNIAIDASVVSTIVLVELLKLILFKKLREQRKGKYLQTFLTKTAGTYFNLLLQLFSVICNCIAVFLTLVTACGVIYIFYLQSPVLKLEYILCSMLSLLIVSELLFGFLQIFPCFKPKEIYS